MSAMPAFVVLLSLSLAPLTQAQQVSENSRLGLRQPITRTLAPGARHSYLVRLEAGQTCRVVVVQQGVDVIVAVYAPDGSLVREVDSPNGRSGPEAALVESAVAGDYRVEVRPYDGDEPEGRYEVQLVSLLTATERASELEAARALEAGTLAWLRSSGARLTTVEAGSGFADMAPVGRMVGNARLVALGEATHGTREFFQLKHRMLEYLVAQHGFTVFGIEATMPEAHDVNRYVLTGEGDPGRALTGLYFWTWDTEEVLDMIRWMRAWNADPSHARKVKFYGFDMQSPSRAAIVALDFLRRVEPSAAAGADSALGMLRNPFLAEEYSALPETERRRMLEAARALEALLDRHRVAAAGGVSWAVARQHARILAQNLAMQLAPDSGIVVRDRSMAENIRWILDQEGPAAKMVAWAHNGHIASDSGATVWMGHYLRRGFGSSLVSFGFAFGAGGFQAMEMPFPSRRGLTVFSVGRLADSTLDGMLGRVGSAVAAFDLRRMAAGSPAARWFSEPRLTRSIGAGYSVQAGAAFIGPQQSRRLFDVLLYVDSTTAARPNAAGSRASAVPAAAPQNLDFEELDSECRISGWNYNVGRQLAFGYEVATSDSAAHGRRALELRRAPGPRYGESYGGASQLLDATPYRGRRVRVRMQARAEGTGEARLYARAARPLQSILDPPAPRPSAPVRGAGWRLYEVVVDVPPDGTTLTVGVALVGDGRAWFDDARIDVIP